MERKYDFIIVRKFIEDEKFSLYFNKIFCSKKIKIFL